MEVVVEGVGKSCRLAKFDVVVGGFALAALAGAVALVAKGRFLAGGGVALAAGAGLSTLVGRRLMGSKPEVQEVAIEEPAPPAEPEEYRRIRVYLGFCARYGEYGLVTKACQFSRLRVKTVSAVIEAFNEIKRPELANRWETFIEAERLRKIADQGQEVYSAKELEQFINTLIDNLPEGSSDEAIREAGKDFPEGDGRQIKEELERWVAYQAYLRWWSNDLSLDSDFVPLPKNGGAQPLIDLIKDPEAKQKAEKEVETEAFVIY